MDKVEVRDPKFGEWLRGIHASESNQHRDGMYARTIRRTGRLNPGTWYVLTDGCGGYWEYPAESVTRIAAPQPPSGGEVVAVAERRIAEAGAFAGLGGLRGLADAASFWDRQPYGTRLYYGDGGLDYLHRDVLRAAVRSLDTAPPSAPVGVAGDVAENAARAMYSAWVDSQDVHCNRFPAWHELSEARRSEWFNRVVEADTGIPEADNLIGRLMHADPTFGDCADAAAFIRKTALAQQPAANSAAKHWHDLYRAECLRRQDDAARYGQQIADLEAQQPAAMECPHRTRCDCLAACKYGYAGALALAAQPGGNDDGAE